MTRELNPVRRKRPHNGRALFYTRDSQGRDNASPSSYVQWAITRAKELEISFSGIPERIESMMRDHRSQDGDIFLDYGITGNHLRRPGLDALIHLAKSDEGVSHILVPRRDRLARPDDPTDAIKIENELRRCGLTLVFMDRICEPLGARERPDLSEAIVSLLEYNVAGEFRRELAQKMIHAQINLARAGYSVGGRPPFGFRRWLVRGDGITIRQLLDGEYVRMADHHVVWLPGPDEEVQLIRRIVDMVRTLPASRVAAMLTGEGIPAPDSGRSRTDRGVKHVTSGVWHQTTVTNIVRNPLLIAIMTYGRRSMGDQLRYTPNGPRDLEDTDLRSDGQPKVVANSSANYITSAAKFSPIITEHEHQQLISTLDQRGKTQRGKPRSRNPEQNPLGARIFDMNCGWPMYRQPYKDEFRYVCGFYQQSHGAECDHNHVDGRLATSFLLESIRQRLFSARTRMLLEQRISKLVHNRGDNRNHDVAGKLRSELCELRRKKDCAAENLALAESAEQRTAVASVFDRIVQEEKGLQERLTAAEKDQQPAGSEDQLVEAAMAEFDRLGEQAQGSENLESIAKLFDQLNARLFLKFEWAQLKKRKVNRLTGGVITFGATDPPVTLYQGPTGRRALRGQIADLAQQKQLDASRFASDSCGQEGQSLGNSSRGDRI